MWPVCNWSEWRWSGPGQSRGGDASESPHQAQSGSSWQETQTAASCEYCNYGLSSGFYALDCSRVIDSLFTYTMFPCPAWKDTLTMHTQFPGTLFLSDNHSVLYYYYIMCHIWVCLTDDISAFTLTAACINAFTRCFETFLCAVCIDWLLSQQLNAYTPL